MRRLPERPRGRRLCVALLRWMLPVAFLLPGLTHRAPEAPPVATSSGTHAWWVRAGEGGWQLVHGVADATGASLSSRTAARFDGEPALLAAEDARVWAIFRGRAGRSQVMAGEARRNPASDLWFTAPAGMRLHASLPVESVESAAAFDGSLWCLEAGNAIAAWRLSGEDWRSETLPDHAPAATRSLVVARGSLWLLVRQSDGSTRRWSRDGAGWRAASIEAPAWSRAVPGCSMLTLEDAQGALMRIEAGRAIDAGQAPAGAAALGWGDRCGALFLAGGEAKWSLQPPGSVAFGAPATVAEQTSRASRWFHLPILGTLSLGALMLAGILRAVRGERGGAPAPAPLSPVRRLAAFVIDALPVAIAAALAFDAPPEALLVPPLLATDIEQARPFVVMTLGLVAFGTIEECVSARSMGKRVVGGAVVRSDGSPATAVRHLLRNALKGLVMLSPILALPTIASRRGVGVPEVIADTAVVRA